MNNRVLYLGAALILAVLAIGLLIVVTAVAVPAVANAAPPVREQAPDLFARRVISIPFGIDTPLAIVADGNAVLVTGHGICPEGGESFQLRTTVQQDGAMAMGRTGGDCVGGQSLAWEALALSPPPQQFQPGPAQACGMVRFFFLREGAIVHRWCVDVNLQ